MEKKTVKQENAAVRKRPYRSISKSYTAQQKVEAVLTVWGERRSPAQVCREAGITWTILNQWQERAMEGMLQALEPRVSLVEGPALSARLQTLLTRRQAACSARMLSRRLRQVQKAQPQVDATTQSTEG